MVGTRFYFDSVAAAPVTPPAAGSEWEHSNLATARRLNRTKQSSTMTNASVNYDGSDHLVDQDALNSVYVSDPLNGGISIGAQTLKIQFRATETSVANNLFLTYKVYLMNAAGAASSTILAITRDNTEVAVAGSITNRQFSATTSSVTTTAGDRLVIEIGLGGLPTASAGVQGHNGVISIGDDSATDLPEDDTTTAANNPWIEFGTTTLTFIDYRTPGTASLTLSPQNPRILSTMSPGVANLSLSRQNPITAKSYVPSAPSLSLARQNPSTTKGYTPATDSLSLSRQNPATAASYVPGARALTLAPQQPSTTKGYTPSAAALTLALQNPASARSFVPGAATLTLSPQNPSITRTFQPGTRVLAIALQPPNAVAAGQYVPGTCFLTLSLNAPTVARVFQVPTASLSLAPQNPSTTFGFTPAAAILGLSPQQALLTRGFLPGSAVLTLSPQAPSSGGLTFAYTPGSAVLTLALHAPSLTGGYRILVAAVAQLRQGSSVTRAGLGPVRATAGVNQIIRSRRSY